MGHKRLTYPTKKRVLARSISLPVQECLSGEWKDFMKTLHTAWQQSTALANWASQAIARHDVVRTPDMTELPPFEPIDLYALAFGRAKEGVGRQKYRCAHPPCNRQWQAFQLEDLHAPEHKHDRAPCPGSGRQTAPVDRKVLPPLPAQMSGFSGSRIAAAGLLRRVLSKYLKERGKIVWRRERRSPEFAYPHPFPVPASAWTLWFDKGRPVIALALPGGRVSLRLRNGEEFAGAVRVLKGIEDGTIKAGELYVCRQRSYCPDRKDRDRLAGGGHRNSYRVMLRISYQMEVAEVPDGNTVVQVRTGADPFVTVDVPGCVQWVLHVPQMAQHIIAHKAFRDRFADDLKFEKRWPRGKRRRMLRRLERGCDKQNRRLDSFCKETAAQVVGYIERAVKRALLPAGVRIEWDDKDRSYAPTFPFHQLRAAMSCKAEERQMRLEIVESNGDAAEIPA